MLIVHVRIIPFGTPSSSTDLIVMVVFTVTAQVGKKKRFSDPFNSQNVVHDKRPTLLVEPSPNLLALKSQLMASKQLTLISSNKIRSVYTFFSFSPWCGAFL